MVRLDAYHLDQSLAERAAQWAPQIFLDGSRENREYRTFESYRALLESSINSFLTADGCQKVFKTEIDLIYPPDHELFYKFLEKIVEDSLAWTASAIQIVESDIQFHTKESIEELGAVAGKTNFDLKSDSDFEYDDDERKPILKNAIEKLREIGADEKIIQFLQSKIQQ